MFLHQKNNDLEASIPALRPSPADYAETLGTAGGQEVQDIEHRLTQAAVEDYLDRVCAPFIETLPYTARIEMRREIASHIKALVDAYEELGDPPATATQKALVKFGSPEQVAKLWRESSMMSSGSKETKIQRLARGLRKQWPTVSVTLSALFLLAGWLSPLHHVASGQQSVGTAASAVTSKGGSNLAAGLSIAGFKHMEAVQDKNCVDCHRAPAELTHRVDQTFLVEQTKQWMQAKAQREKASNVRP